MPSDHDYPSVDVPTPFSKIFGIKTTVWNGVYQLYIKNKARYVAWCETEMGAVQVAIHKWQVIIMCYYSIDNVGFIFDGSHHTCGLCKLYLEDDCVNCPVGEHDIDSDHCQDTPYADYASLTSIVEGIPDDRIEKTTLLERGRYVAMQEMSWLLDIGMRLQYDAADLAGHILLSERD